MRVSSTHSFPPRTPFKRLRGENQLTSPFVKHSLGWSIVGNRKLTTEKKPTLPYLGLKTFRNRGSQEPDFAATWRWRNPIPGPNPWSSNSFWRRRGGEVKRIPLPHLCGQTESTSLYLCIGVEEKRTDFFEVAARLSRSLHEPSPPRYVWTSVCKIPS